MKTATLIALFGSATALSLTKKGGEGAPQGEKPEGEKPEGDFDLEDFEELEEDGDFLEAFGEGLLENGLVTEEELEAAAEDWEELTGGEQVDMGEEFFAFADTDGSDDIDLDEGVAAFRAFAGEYLGEEAGAVVDAATDDEIAEQLVEFLGDFDEDGSFSLCREEVGLPPKEDDGDDDYYGDYYGYGDYADYYGDYGYDDELELEGEGPEGPKPEEEAPVEVTAAQKGKGPKPECGDDTEEEIEGALEELTEEELAELEAAIAEKPEELEELLEAQKGKGPKPDEDGDDTDEEIEEALEDLDESELEDLEAAIADELEGEAPEGPKPEGEKVEEIVGEVEEALAAQKGKGPKPCEDGDDEEGDCFFEAAGEGLIEAGLVTEEDLEALVADFEALDADEQDALAEEIFTTVDTDEDGEISATEGAVALMDYFGADHEAFQDGSVEDVAAALGEYFGGFDKDGSGALSVEEMTGDVADEE